MKKARKVNQATIEMFQLTNEYLRRFRDGEFKGKSTKEIAVMLNCPEQRVAWAVKKLLTTNRLRRLKWGVYELANDAPVTNAEYREANALLFNRKRNKSKVVIPTGSSLLKEPIELPAIFQNTSAPLTITITGTAGDIVQLFRN